jgi:hypothetical protein
MKTPESRRCPSLPAIVRALAFCCILPLVLTQCRTVKACINFFKDHASTGHASASAPRHTAPTRPMSVDEFIAANAHRCVSTETLRKRFSVADLDRDGILTPGEIQRHREMAAANKKRAQGAAANRWIDGVLD